MEDQTNPVTSSLQQAAMALRTAAGDPAHTPRPAKGG